MKKSILLTLACFLIFTASCANGTSNPSQNSAITTSPSIHSNPTEPTASSTTSQEFIGAIPPPLEVEQKGDLSLLFHHADLIQWTFYSLEDFETFLYTDSRNPADYSTTPYPNLSGIPGSDAFLNHYISPKVLFGDDPHLLDSLRYCGITLNGSEVTFGYYFGDFYIVLIYEPNALRGNTTVDYYREYHATRPAERYEFFDNLQATKQHESGYIVRPVGGYDPIYKFENNILQNIRFVVDDYLVGIIRTYDFSPGDTVQNFQTFMTQASTAPVAPLFSEDDKAFESALSKIVIAIRAKTQSLSESTLD